MDTTPAAQRFSVDFCRHDATVARAWARAPVEPTADERVMLKARIRRMLREQDATLLAHYYVHPDLQDLAEATGGCVADSLRLDLQNRDLVDQLTRGNRHEQFGHDAPSSSRDRKYKRRARAQSSIVARQISVTAARSVANSTTETTLPPDSSDK